MDLKLGSNLCDVLGLSASGKCLVVWEFQVLGKRALLFKVLSLTARCLRISLCWEFSSWQDFGFHHMRERMRACRPGKRAGGRAGGWTVGRAYPRACVLCACVPACLRGCVRACLRACVCLCPCLVMGCGGEGLVGWDVRG